jgi:hypothetical protein
MILASADGGSACKKKLKPLRTLRCTKENLGRSGGIKAFSDNLALSGGATCTKVTYPKSGVRAMMGLRPAVSLTRK